MLFLFPGAFRWDEIPELPYDLWLSLRARVDAWRQGQLHRG